MHVLRFAELYGSGLEALPECLKQEEGVDMALEKLGRAYASDEVREMIEFRLKAEHDEASRMERALAQGEAAGRAALLEAGRKLLARGMPPEEVAEITGLSVEELG